MLLAHLPPDSAFGRALNGEGAEWTVERELLATLVDITNQHRWQHARVNFKGVSKQPPDRVPRPHAPSHTRSAGVVKRRHMTHAEMAEAFGLPLRVQPDEDVEGGGV